jgi:hypothetical protein
VLGALAVAQPALAAPSFLPSFAGVVQNACTGLPVFGASETLIQLAGQQPEPPTIRLGPYFAYQALPAGTYAFQVSAPGYQAISGAPITIPQGPAQVPAGDSVTLGIGAVVRLAPAGGCVNAPLPPPALPAIVGTVRDVETGLLIPCADNIGGDPENPPPCGRFDVGTTDSDAPGVFVSGALPAGNYTLSVSSPRHTPVAGIPITVPTPYHQGASSLTLTTALDIQLAPCANC